MPDILDRLRTILRRNNNNINNQSNDNTIRDHFTVPVSEQYPSSATTNTSNIRNGDPHNNSRRREEGRVIARREERSRLRELQNSSASPSDEANMNTALQLSNDEHMRSYRAHNDGDPSTKPPTYGEVMENPRLYQRSETGERLPTYNEVTNLTGSNNEDPSLSTNHLQSYASMTTEQTNILQTKQGEPVNPMEMTLPIQNAKIEDGAVLNPPKSNRRNETYRAW